MFQGATTPPAPRRVLAGIDRIIAGPDDLITQVYRVYAIDLTKARAPAQGRRRGLK